MRLTLRDRRDLASKYLLYGLFVLLPFTVAFGHRGVAPWLLLASVPAFLRGDFWQTAYGELFDKAGAANPYFAAFAAALGFCAWVLISGIWSPEHHYALFLYVLAPLLVGGSVIWFALHLTPLWKHRLATAFALSVACGMAVLAFEGVTDGFLRSVLPPDEGPRGGARDIIELGRGVTALAPALFPASIIVATLFTRMAGLAVLALGVVAAVTNDVTANAIAIAAGFSVAVIAFRAPRATLRGLQVTALALLVATPFVAAALPVDEIFAAVSSSAPPALLEGVASWLHRLAVWRSVATEALGALPFGRGADFARAWKETAPMIDVPGATVPLSLMPTHPHNLFLQVWLELGLPGVLALAAAIYWGGNCLLGAERHVAVGAGLCGAIAAIVVSMMVEGSLWQVWRMAAMALAGMGVALSYSITEERAKLTRGRRTHR
ncbi:MAG: O-antigen ligase family protein [Pseudomonadota bacterium]